MKKNKKKYGFTLTELLVVILVLSLVLGIASFVVINVINSSREKGYKVTVNNVEKVLAIELMNAAQALEFRRPLKTSPILEAFVSQYRKVVNFIEEDEVMYTHIANSIEFLRKL